MKKSFIFICMAIATVAFMASCGGKNTDASAEAGSDAETTEASAEEKATPTDAKSILGFDPAELKVADLISNVQAGDITNSSQGAEVEIMVTPTNYGDESFDTFNKALFEKLKAHSGKVYNGEKQEISKPVDVEPNSMSIFTYVYKDGGCDVYCTVSNTAGEKGKDFSLDFTKYY